MRGGDADSPEELQGVCSNRPLREAALGAAAKQSSWIAAARFADLAMANRFKNTPQSITADVQRRASR